MDAAAALSKLEHSSDLSEGVKVSLVASIGRVD